MANTTTLTAGDAAGQAPPLGVASPAAASPATAPPIEADVASPEESIEVDDSTRDDASTIDDRISSYTASLTSSVVDYPTEYGRRYHAFRAGAYNFPNDEPEMERLDLVHSLMVKTIGGNLFLAPLEESKIHRILDILGNDLSPIQPEWVPSNVKFEIDDVESDWVGSHKYDFIFSRYMSGSLADWPTYVKRVYENVAPGGWAEFQDWSFQLNSDDGSLEGTSLGRWCDLFMEASRTFGRDARVGPKLERLVRDNTGLVNIRHRPYKIPLGPWAKDPDLKDVGMCNLVQVLDGLEGFSMKLLCGGLGWTAEEVIVLLAGVRKDLKSENIHAWYHFNVVYGQKPPKEEAGEESNA
ncbi:hypothetical protein CTA2_8262 [Colletotrichum tanaceti]|nr:hypothetical protein CTA2_8262 [Colletotrichum tanaceti]